MLRLIESVELLTQDASDLAFSNWKGFNIEPQEFLGRLVLDIRGHGHNNFLSSTYEFVAGKLRVGSKTDDVKDGLDLQVRVGRVVQILVEGSEMNELPKFGSMHSEIVVNLNKDCLWLLALRADFSQIFFAEDVEIPHKNSRVYVSLQVMKFLISQEIMNLCNNVSEFEEDIVGSILRVNRIRSKYLNSSWEDLDCIQCFGLSEIIAKSFFCYEI